MTARIKGMTPRIEEVIAELKQLISARYPEAKYELADGDDPEGVRLIPIVDVDDLLEVVDIVSPRLVDLQVEEGLQLYVIPERTPERNLEVIRQVLEKRSAAIR
ncbi:MAG: hypothetical protein ACKVVP_22710 [Chloroflexota bacterium]